MAAVTATTAWSQPTDAGAAPADLCARIPELAVASVATPASPRGIVAECRYVTQFFRKDAHLSLPVEPFSDAPSAQTTFFALAGVSGPPQTSFSATRAFGDEGVESFGNDPSTQATGLDDFVVRGGCLASGGLLPSVQKVTIDHREAEAIAHRLDSVMAASPLCNQPTSSSSAPTLPGGAGGLLVSCSFGPGVYQCVAFNKVTIVSPTAAFTWTIDGQTVVGAGGSQVDVPSLKPGEHTIVATVSVNGSTYRGSTVLTAADFSRAPRKPKFPTLQFGLAAASGGFVVLARLIAHPVRRSRRSGAKR